MKGSHLRSWVLAFSVLAGGCSSSHASEPRVELAPTRLEVRAEASPVPRCSLPGLFDAQRRSTLRVPMEGRLELEGLGEGDAVEASQLIARVVDPRVELELHSSSASVEVLEQDRKLAGLSARHAAEQADSLGTIADYVAREELRELERERERTKRGLARSRAQLDLERARHEAIAERRVLGELRPDHDAIIVEQLAEAGAWLPALAPVFTLVDREARRVRVLVDPTVAATLELGQRVEVEAIARPQAQAVALELISIGTAVLDTGLVELELDASRLEGVRIGEMVRVLAPWHERAWCTGT